MASIARYERGETAVFTATLRDKDGAAIAAASLTSLSLTLTDARSGVIVNSRNAQNVLNANNATVNSSGGLVWTIQIADVAQQGTANVERAEHVAKFVAVTSSETIEHIHRLYITATRGLTTYEDVELQLGEIAESDRLFVEQIIDGITARAEEYTGLRFQYASETQVFSPTTFRDSVRVRRRPIASVTSLKEDVDGVFGTDTAFDPTDYYVDADAGTVNLRAGTFLGGHGSVQVVYAGGYRDIGAVPMSLRLAATQQAAYIYQRRSSMGLKSESVSGMSQTRWSEDLLPAFKDALDRLVPPVVF